MPLLARTLTVGIRPGAVCSLGALLAGRRIATEDRRPLSAGTAWRLTRAARPAVM
jgi:hypothetical protein